mgnify:CR=1 FL=1
MKNLKDVKTENCITLVMNTHRTKPDNLQDPILLKNLIKEAEDRINTIEDKQVSLKILEKLKGIEKSVDHNYNLESLIVFVNEHIAEFIRLSIAAENRVILDNSFATRDLIRAMHSESNYYVLVLSQQKVRLIEALNDKVVQEIGEPFPIENDQFHTTNSGEQADAGRVRSLIAEFFNRVDKAVNKQRKIHPLPVLICTEEGNFHEYLKIVDNKNSILDARLNKNRLEEKDHAIVREAWDIVQEYITKRNNERIAELENAVGTGNFLSDMNDIWQALNQGRIKTLFVENGLYQPGIISENGVELVDDNQKHDSLITDDIYDEFIEVNLSYGGEVVFLPKGKLDKFQSFGAVTRY